MDTRQLQILHLEQSVFRAAPVSLLYRTRFHGRKNITLSKIRFCLHCLPLLLATVTFVGCTPLASMAPTETKARQVTAETSSEPTASFEPDTLYDLLIAEVAGYNQQFDLALGHYLQQAHKTGDPGLAEQAYRIAAYIGARQAARDAAELWTRVDPGNPAALQVRAIELVRAGEYLAATDEMLQVLEMTGDANFEFIAISATDHQEQKERDMLITAFDRALKRYPDNPKVLSGKAILLQYSGRNTDAIKLCNRILAHDNNLKAVMLKGQALIDMKQPDDARRFLADYVEDTPDNFQLRLLYAEALMRARRSTQAREQLEILLLQAPDNPGIPLLLELTDLENATPEETLSYFMRPSAFSSHGNPAELYLLRSNVLIERQAYEQAASVLNKALKTLPDNVSLLYARAMLAEKMNDLAVLEKDLRKILAIDAENATALNALGYTLADRTGRLDEATRLIARAYALNPDEPAIIDSMGWVAYRQKSYEKALQYLRVAHEKMPDATVSAHLGEVLWVKGNRKEAMQIWEHALEKQPDSKILKETMERLQGGQ